jgi:hypothetical protein
MAKKPLLTEIIKGISLNPNLGWSPEELITLSKAYKLDEPRFWAVIARAEYAPALVPLVRADWVFRALEAGLGERPQAIEWPKTRKIAWL